MRFVEGSECELAGCVEVLVAAEHEKAAAGAHTRVRSVALVEFGVRWTGHDEPAALLAIVGAVGGARQAEPEGFPLLVRGNIDGGLVIIPRALGGGQDGDG